MLGVLVAAGPLILLIRPLLPELERDPGWVYMLLAMMAIITTFAATTAVTIRLPPMVVLVAAIASLLIAGPAIAWVVKQLLIELRGQQTIGKTVWPPTDLLVHLLIRIELLAVSAGLIAGLVVAMVRSRDAC
jgi:membrane-associated PAP2 superfamily phosphatase